MGARPVEEMFDEVQQARVRPLQVLEYERHRPTVGKPLEEEPPRRKEILPLERTRFAERQQMREPRLEPRSLFFVGYRRGERRDQLGERALYGLVLGDARPHPEHFGERPVGDAVAVGETAAPMPPDLLGEPVEVLLELPREPRLPDSGDARRP